MIKIGMSQEKIIIEDNWLGRRVLPISPLEVLKDQLKLLEHWRDDGRVPSELLLQDIRIYKYILHQPNPEKTLTDYCNTRIKLAKKQKCDFCKIKKIEIARHLGWDVS